MRRRISSKRLIWIFSIGAAISFASFGVRADEPGSGTHASHCVGCFRGLPVSLEEIAGSNPVRKKLQRDLFYTDAAGLIWKASAGDITDGASIPDAFIGVIGDRFEPDFLPAAIIHDHYTDDAHKVRPWTDTARVFYEAMVTNNTPIVKAKVMYYAVYVFGPHWGTLKPGQYCGPKCVNIFPNAYAVESDGTDRVVGAVEVLPNGGEFFVEPQHATQLDVPEITQIKSMIEAAEKLGRPMSLNELDRQATLRHSNNVFISIAAQRE